MQRKVFTLRLPAHVYGLLNKMSHANELTKNDYLIKLIEKDYSKSKNKLTSLKAIDRIDN